MIEESLLKSNFTGRDGFIWWIGQIAPPSVWRNEKSEIDNDSGWAYRCKIRIIGYHTFDGNILPDEDLPWAHVMVDPVDGNSQAGLGKKHNLVGGETAFGFFLDGEDAQQPVVVGLIFRNPSTKSLINAESIAQEKSSQFKPFTGNQGNMVKKATQIRNPKKATQENAKPVENPPAIVGSRNNKSPITVDPIPFSRPKNDPSSDRLFSEDIALGIALKEAMSVKIVRENGCSNNTIGKITQVLRDFVEITNGLQRYRSVYIDPLLNKVVDITDTIKSTARKIIGLLKSIINIMRSTVLGLVSKLFRELVALIVPDPQVPIVAEATKNIHNLIFCLFEKLLDYVLDFVEDLLLGLVGKAVSVPLCAAEEWIAALLSKVNSLLDDLLEPILSGISWLTGILDIVSDALSTVSGIANKIISFIGCDQLKCETPSEWSMRFGPSQSDADSWGRVLDNMKLFDSFSNGVDEAASFLSLFGYGSQYFSTCSEEVLLSEPPLGMRTSCRPPQVSLYGGGGIGGSGTPIVSETGEILSIEVTSPGIGYRTPPTVNIIDKTNNGSGARAGAVIENGSITGFYMIKYGKNYCSGDYTYFYSPPYYVVTADKYSVYEGDVIKFTISGFNINKDVYKYLSYEITGLESDEVEGASLSGDIVLNESNTFSVQIRPIDDSVVEGFEVATFILYNSSSKIVAKTTIVVNDSDLPTPITITTGPESPPGNPFPVDDGETVGTAITTLVRTGSSTFQGLQGLQDSGGGITTSITTQGIQTLQGIIGIDETQVQINTQGLLYSVQSQGIQGLRVQKIQGLQGINDIIYTDFQGIQGISVGFGTFQGLQGIQDGFGGGQGIQGIQGIQDDFVGGGGSGGIISSQGLQGISGGFDGDFGRQSIQGISGVLPGTNGKPEVVIDNFVVISPGTGYTSGDSIQVGSGATFTPEITSDGSIVDVSPNIEYPLSSFASFISPPAITINTNNGEGAAVFPVFKLKRNFKTAPLVINQNGILKVIDCI